MAAGCSVAERRLTFLALPAGTFPSCSEEVDEVDNLKLDYRSPVVYDTASGWPECVIPTRRAMCDA